MSRKPTLLNLMGVAGELPTSLNNLDTDTIRVVGGIQRIVDPRTQSALLGAIELACTVHPIEAVSLSPTCVFLDENLRHQNADRHLMEVNEEARSIIARHFPHLKFYEAYTEPLQCTSKALEERVVLFTCMDPRMNGYVEKLRQHHPYLLLLRWPGAASFLLRGSSLADCFERQAEILEKQLESGLRAIVLGQHWDCAAIGGSASKAGPRQEVAEHRALLEEAVEVIHGIYHKIRPDKKPPRVAGIISCFKGSVLQLL